MKVITTVMMLGILWLVAPAIAQHEEHTPAPKKETEQPRKSRPQRDTHRKEEPPKPDTMTSKATHVDTAMGHAMHGMAMENMTSVTSMSLPMERDGSGTSWHPDLSPVNAIHTMAGDWRVMLHGAIFPRLTAQNLNNSDRRGYETRLDAPSWVMAMAERPLGERDRIALRGMFSLDPLIEGGRGYPLLFQTGETFEGEPLIDRQHPHDLFSELAIIYNHSFSHDLDGFLYVGLPGEPALGAPAFMHRPSALVNPNSPLGHHWQDATHITFGVATAGIRYGIVKLEGSVFTGREPDEERYGIDRPRFDSYSARVSANPDERTALQVSYGLLKSPEALEPDIDIRRASASVLYHLPLSGEGIWTTSLIWGANVPVAGSASVHEVEETSHSFLVESSLPIGNGALYARGEAVQKSNHELGIETDEIAATSGEALHWISALTLGGTYRVFTLGDLWGDLGLQGAIHFPNDDLKDLYGSTPLSAVIYVRIYPALMSTSRHEMPGRSGAE